MKIYFLVSRYKKWFNILHKVKRTIGGYIPQKKTLEVVSVCFCPAHCGGIALLHQYPGRGNP
jgi:hypothetical protein